LFVLEHKLLKERMPLIIFCHSFFFFSARAKPAATFLRSFFGAVAEVFEVTCCLVTCCGCVSESIVKDQPNIQIVLSVLSSVPSRLLSAHSRVLSVLSRVLSMHRPTEIDMFRCDERRVGYHEQPPTFQSKTSDKCGQLFGADVILFDILLQSFNVFNRQKNHNPPCVNRDKAIDKGFSGLVNYIGLVPFVVLLLTCFYVSCAPMASFHLPVGTRIASSSRSVGMSG